MAAMPTLGQVIERTADDFGVSVEVVADSGVEHRYLLRTIDGRPHFALIPEGLQTDDVLVPSMLRHFCDGLSIPAETFGFVLG